MPDHNTIHKLTCFVKWFIVAFHKKLQRKATMMKLEIVVAKRATNVVA
jgi:hypothetical protein